MDIRAHVEKSWEGCGPGATFKRNYALEGDPGKGTPAGCQVDVWPKAQQSLAQELEIFSLKGLMVTT